MICPYCGKEISAAGLYRSGKLTRRRRKTPGKKVGSFFKKPKAKICRLGKKVCGRNGHWLFCCAGGTRDSHQETEPDGFQEMLGGRRFGDVRALVGRKLFGGGWNREKISGIWFGVCFDGLPMQVNTSLSITIMTSPLTRKRFFLFMTHREDWRMTLHSMNTESLRMEPGLSLDRQMSRKSVI